MKNFFSVILVICLSYTGAFCQHDTYQGEYLNNALTPESAYQLLFIHVQKNGAILFYLEAGRGAPSYNSGALYGRLITNKKNGHLQYLAKDTTHDCSIDFLFINNTVTVKTINGLCPFGYGVYPDGIYKRKERSNPKYFIDREGDTTWFEKTAPEAYLH